MIIAPCSIVNILINSELFENSLNQFNRQKNKSTLRDIPVVPVTDVTSNNTSCQLRQRVNFTKFKHATAKDAHKPQRRDDTIINRLLLKHIKLIVSENHDSYLLS